MTRADSRPRLQQLLDADFRGLIVSMIHKFDGIRKDCCTRDNVYVFIDEAHRSVAQDLGTYLMAAVPNATIIGFTGTPIDKTEQGEGTFKIFGVEDERGYLDKYSIKESIEDETTLPIKHMMAPSTMTVPAERLDYRVLCARGDRRRHRHRGTQPRPRPRGRTSHIPDCGRPRRQRRRLRRRAFPARTCCRPT